MGTKTLSESFVKIIQHNVRGPQKDEYMEEFIAWFEQLKGYAACLQETWKLGDTTEEHEDSGCVILNHGPPAKLCRRGSLGVAIVIARRARRAWEKAGSQALYFGLRIIATRLHLEDGKGRPVAVYLVSAYAPIGAAPRAEREVYNSQLQACMNECGKHEILVIGTDANASAGVRSAHDDPYAPGRDRVRGPFGMEYQNAAGRELCTFLGTQECCLASTFFKHRPSHAGTYGTWQSPCSKRFHQIDHLIMRQRDMKRVRNVERIGMHGKNSDHYGVCLKLRITRKLKHKCPLRKPGRIDRGLLVKDPEPFLGQFKTEIAKDHDGTVYQHLEASLSAAADATLMTTERRQPGWFEAQKHLIQPAIMVRNAAQSAFHAHPTEDAKATLKKARKSVKSAVTAADNTWLNDTMARIDGMGTGASPADCWAAITALRKGKSMTKKLEQMSLRKPDGTLCQGDGENAKVMADYLGSCFDKTGDFDPAAIDKVRQRDPKQYEHLGATPTDAEISAGVRKLGNNKSGGDAGIPAEYYKALEGDEETCKYLREVVRVFWESGSYQPPVPSPPPETLPPEPAPLPPRRSSRAPKISGIALTAIANAPIRRRVITPPAPLPAPLPPIVPPLPDWIEGADSLGTKYDEWLVARMKLLPKKGDLAQCKNWRAICLLDIASKILSCVLVARMNYVQEREGLEAQAGFRGKRGTIDGLFNAIIALMKRKEHNLATWGLFIDLVKAFDSVNRAALWLVLRKFGFPDHFINILIRLHTGALMKFKVGETDTEVSSNIGVRQGACEGPSLFLFIMQAALETMVWPVAKPQFCTREAGEVAGEKWDRVRGGVETFDLFSSLFADDCAVFFNTRADLIIGANYLNQHLLSFGLQMHIGRGDVASKTEAMHFPAPHSQLNDADKADFDVADGFISFTDDFRYLGSTIHESLTSDADVDARIRKATAAFGALRDCFFANKRISAKDKGKGYTVLVLTILLYGSECWCLREDLFNRLRVFHNRCVRSMCRVTMRHVIRHHISDSDLRDRVGLEPLDHYYNTRLLRWAGHVARMPMTRTPRKLLTGWVKHKRPRGAPSMTFGRTLNKALKAAKIPSTQTATWMRLAQDRNEWRKLTHKH
jgi:hypothetical protein